MSIRNFAMDRKNRSDTGVCIDVGGAIEGIEHQNVFTPLTTMRDWNDVFGFFRSHDAQMAVVAHDAIHGFLREHVQLRYGVAMNIKVPRVPEDLCQSGS